MPCTASADGGQHKVNCKLRTVDTAVTRFLAPVIHNRRMGQGHGIAWRFARESDSIFALAFVVISVTAGDAQTAAGGPRQCMSLCRSMCLDRLWLRWGAA
jgi:hypothetical protein